MRIISVAVKPCERTVSPGMVFEVEIGHVKYAEAIVGVSGWLETDDGKIVAEINEASLDERRACEVGARESFYDKKFTETIYKTNLIACFSEKELEHMENRRLQDRKGDLRLILNLNVKYVVSKAVVAHTYKVNPKNVRMSPISVTSRGGRVMEGALLVSAYDPDFFSQHSDGYIISGGGQPTFLSIEEMTFKTERRISASDWILDFGPKLGLGEYFIVEISKGEEIVKEAWKYVETAEECYRRWDTKGAFANCREVGSLFDRLIKNKFGGKSFTYKELWGRTYQRFERLASLDLHVEDLKKSAKYATEEVKIGKEETEHIILLTKALTKYAEELLQR